MTTEQPLDVFICVDNPGQKPTAEVKKRIRSRAAKHSHAIGRRNYTSARQTVERTMGPSELTQHVSRLICDGIVLPVPEQAFFKPTLAFMWKWMLSGWMMLDVSDSEQADALVWTQQLTFSSPPYFYMNMLSCCRNLAGRGLFDARLLPWLMCQTVKAINEALKDERHADTGVILTVGRIALLECVQGNLEIGQHVHRPAQAQILAMAGGLEALAIPSLVRKHIMWAERLVCKRTGVSLKDLNPGAMLQDPMLLDQGNDEEMLNAYRLQQSHAPRNVMPE